MTRTQMAMQKLKNSWRLVSTLGLVLAFTTLAAAQGSQQIFRPVAPESQPARMTAATQAAKAVTDAARLVTEFDVNGLKVIVKRREGSQTVAGGLFIRGGARNVAADNAGVEALMLDVATEASANFPRERMRAELASMGTSIGYGVNYDYSALSFGSTRSNFDRSWEIFTDAALRPSFTVEDFERVKNRLVVSRSDDDDTPDAYLQALQAKAAYAGHPYLNDPRGTVESISRLKLEDVRRYHQQMMQTSRLLIVVVGDLDPEQFRKRVEATFGKLPRGEYHPAALPALAFPTQTVEVTSRPLPTTYVQGVFVAPAMTAPDIYPMRVASSILQNRVFVEVRARRNLSYAPDAFLWSQGANLGGIYVTSTNANQSIRVMLDEISKLQNNPISTDDLNSTVQHYLTRYYLSQETNAAQAGELAQYELIGGGWRNSGVYLDRLRTVTPADVQRVAKTYMRNIRFVVLGNPESIDKNAFVMQSGG